MEGLIFDRFGEFILNSICNLHAVIIFHPTNALEQFSVWKKQSV